MPELSDYNGLFALERALGVPKIYHCIATTETWPEWLGETGRYKFVVAFLCARVSCYRRRVELGCCFGVIPTDSVIGTASGQFYHRPNMPVRIGRPANTATHTSRAATQQCNNAIKHNHSSNLSYEQQSRSATYQHRIRSSS